jgi:large subunit ribosomal protein L11
MANKKEIKANLKMRIPAGKASAAPPVGSTLGQYGVNMMDFITPFNEQTKEMKGVLTAHITIYEDRSMDFRVVSEAVDEQIRAKLGVQKGSGKPNTEKLAKKLSDADLTAIAENKAKDMNTEDIEAVKKMVAGTARSMGVEVES